MEKTRYLLEGFNFLKNNSIFKKKKRYNYKPGSITNYQWSGKGSCRAAISLYVKLFKDHVGEDPRRRPKHLAPSRSSPFVEP